MNLVRTFRFDLDRAYEKYVRDKSGAFRGDMLISSMRIYDNKLYACYGHMWKVGKKREAKATNNPFFILVYDLKNGELVERINCPAIDEHTVAAFIIGARNHKIYLYVIGNKESMSTFGDSIGYNWSSQGGAIIVVE